MAGGEKGSHSRGGGERGVNHRSGESPLVTNAPLPLVVRDGNWFTGNCEQKLFSESVPFTIVPSCCWNISTIFIEVCSVKSWSTTLVVTYCDALAATLAAALA